MSLTAKTVNSIIYTGSTKLVQRGLGVISMLILARILTPEDFGIVSICTLAVFLFNSLGDVGAKQYIIRIQDIDDDILNTAWTLNIGIKLSLWLFFITFSSNIASFLGKPEIETPLRFLSLILVFGCLGNPGVWIMSRNLNYKPLFKIDVTSKILSFITVLIIVYFERTYWAMLIGVVLSYLLPCIFSHFICSHKPRFKLVNISQQMKFSQWVVANSIVGYARGEGDSVLVAKYFNLEMIGIYSMFKNLSSMPLTQLIAPATDPLLATFSTTIREKNFQAYQLNIVLLMLLSLVIPLTTLMVYFNQEIVLLFLGDKWGRHAYIFSILAFMMVPGVIFKVLSEYILAEGGYKPIVYYQSCMTVLTIGILYTIIGSDLEEFAITRVLIAVFSLFIFTSYFQVRYGFFKLADLILFMLPIIASSLALLTITAFESDSIHWLAKLILGCLIFFIIYSIALLGLIFLNKRRYECVLFLSYIAGVKRFLKI
ncbi:oligosaccharide flippase family protein [Paraglaciecola polaris]|uniref:Polysaccharide transporter, PST family n=1 Tax=Paraglaciecola polaris LMG 21857 TaxID=1129793 RepID=K6ZL69_9ALTE|nr:oligosaccharide flippase family protein [Paraglaciecola polaris]GAC31077.1 polysaccharide transporter, PST family [Paraglaciecola polaris LMG 21857]